MSRITKAERAEALARLKEMIKPGTVLDVAVVSVSRSGMYAHVSLKFVDRDGDWRHLEYNAATAGIGDRREHLGRSTIGIGGCGFSRTLEVCDHLARVLNMRLVQGKTISYQGKRVSPPYTVSDDPYSVRPAKKTEPGARPTLYMREG